MKAPTCSICRKPMSRWYELRDDVNICIACGNITNLHRLSQMGIVSIQPETFKADFVVADDSSDYQTSKQTLSSLYGKMAVYDDTDFVDDDFNDAVRREEISVSYPDLGHNMTIDEIVSSIHKLGFATEDAFFAHVHALMKGDYTEEDCEPILLYNRYNEKTVADEIGTHFNALEGETPKAAIDNMLEHAASVDRVADELIIDGNELVAEMNAMEKARMESVD